MTKPTLDNRTYSNRSTDRVGEVATFGTSKFTSTQIEDRLRVHAISITLGDKTLPQIVAYWYEKYNIEVSVATEKEWRKNNRERIQKKALQMIEAGELVVPDVGPDAVVGMLTQKAIKTRSIMGKIQKKLDMVVQELNLTKDGAGIANIDLAHKKVQIIVDLYNTISKDQRADLQMILECNEIRKIKDRKVGNKVKEVLETMKQSEEELMAKDIEVLDPDDLERAREELLNGSDKGATT